MASDAGAGGRARELTLSPTLPIVLRMSATGVRTVTEGKGTPRSLSTSPVAARGSAPLKMLVKLADLMDQRRHEQQQRQRRPHDPSRRCPDLPEFAQFLDDLDDQPHPEQDMIGPADTGSQKFIEAVGGRRRVLGSWAPQSLYDGSFLSSIAFSASKCAKAIPLYSRQPSAVFAAMRSDMTLSGWPLA